MTDLIKELDPAIKLAGLFLKGKKPECADDDVIEFAERVDNIGTQAWFWNRLPEEVFMYNFLMFEGRRLNLDFIRFLKSW